MPPDKRSGPHASTGRRQPPQTTTATITDGADGGRRCDQCAGPLTGRRRRFCTDECRRKGQKAERVIEDTDYAAGVVRLIRSMGKRASADLEALQWLAGAVDYARDALAMAVDGCRARGYSDGEIGAALGISRQAVGQRFGRKREVYAGQPESGAAG
jgi:DNA-directed RNA polymerase specialized sigma24 family protein